MEKGERNIISYNYRIQNTELQLYAIRYNTIQPIYMYTLEYKKHKRNENDVHGIHLS